MPSPLLPSLSPVFFLHQMLVSDLVDSNVFIRSLILSLHSFRTGVPLPPYLAAASATAASASAALPLQEHTANTITTTATTTAAASPQPLLAPSPQTCISPDPSCAPSCSSLHPATETASTTSTSPPSSFATPCFEPSQAGRGEGGGGGDQEQSSEREGGGGVGGSAGERVEETSDDVVLGEAALPLSDGGELGGEHRGQGGSHGAAAYPDASNNGDRGSGDEERLSAAAKGKAKLSAPPSPSPSPLPSLSPSPSSSSPALSASPSCLRDTDAGGSLLPSPSPPINAVITPNGRAHPLGPSSAHELSPSSSRGSGSVGRAGAQGACRGSGRKAAEQGQWSEDESSQLIAFVECNRVLLLRDLMMVVRLGDINQVGGGGRRRERGGRGALGRGGMEEMEVESRSVGWLA